VSIDGLQPEQDVRRAPATYDRIIKHIKAQITIHTTVTHQQTRPGYLAEFTDSWSASPDVKRIWFSLYTPQKGERSWRCCVRDRAGVVKEISRCTQNIRSSATCVPGGARLLTPPPTPDECIFAKTTACLFGGFETGHYAVPVRRRSGLHAVRLPGLGRSRRSRPAQSAVCCR